MEEQVNIDTGDGPIIYGTLNYPARATDKLIIFVHGITGSRKEHQFYGAARFFPANGYATYRFNLYSRESRGRVLSDIGIRTQSKDLDTVISHFKGKFGQLFLVGHSLGGPTIMWADLDPVKAVVLWDPSLVPPVESFRYEEQLKKYIAKWQFEFFISPGMVEEWKGARSLVHRMTKPVRIIFAGNYSIMGTWKDALAEIPAEHDSTTIEGAGHGFDEEGTQEQLFSRTLEWLDTH
jgi:dienelactone hydrolase